MNRLRVSASALRPPSRQASTVAVSGLARAGILFALVCAAICAAPVDEEIQYIFPDEADMANLVWWRVAAGDDEARRQPEYDDSGWDRIPGAGLWVLHGLPPRGVVWYRKTVFFPEPLDTFQTLAIYLVAAVAAAEVYWDGVLIGHCGRPGVAATTELSGASGAILPIPRNLVGSRGTHVVALRVSNARLFSGLLESPPRLGYLSRMRRAHSLSQALSMFFAGMFVLAALFHSAILFGRGYKWPYALFSGFCLSCAVYTVIRNSLIHFQIDLSHYYLLALVNDIPWLLMMGLLPTFFLYEFHSPLRARLSTVIWVTAGLVVMLPRLVPLGLLPAGWLPAFTMANQGHAYATIVVSLAVALWGWRRGQTGSRTASFGLLAFLAGVYGTNRMGLENAWAVGLVVLNVSLAVLLARQMAERNRQHHESELRSARLEVELLKKHIQPHFLLNSLNSTIAWLEEDPATAATLISTLASELRMVLEFSGQKDIALRDEIALCREHLKLMSLRQEKSFTLETQGLRGDERLPPLVMHTLVENGLTHGYRGKSRGTFVLSSERLPGGLRLHLFNDGAAGGGEVLSREGTGFRYVKARLEESYPSRWSMASGPVEGGWQVDLDLEAR